MALSSDSDGEHYVTYKVTKITTPEVALNTQNVHFVWLATQGMT
jgi:hypothetical protein